MKKALMVAATGVLVMFLLICGFVLYRVLTWGRPLALTYAKVVSGRGLLSRQVFYSAPDLDLITDIHRSKSDGLVVAGQGGAVFLTEQGAVTKVVHFSCRSDVTVIEFADAAFLCRGSWSIGTTLIDSAGQTLWSFATDGVDDAAAGPLGPQNTMRVVVGLNGDGGVRLLSPEGKELWKQEDGNVWHVEIAATDEKSDNVILHSNAAGQLTIRDAAGKVLGRYAPDGYLAHFSLTGWNDDPHVNKVISTRDGVVHVMTMEARTLALLPAPSYSGDIDTKGTPVRFSSGRPYYASLFRFPTWSRSVLYIYNDQKNVVYDEILGDECAGLRAIPGKNGQEDLLVGCKGIVWKYTAGGQPSGSK